MKAWSEITISKCLYHKMEKDGNLCDFQSRIYHDLQRALFQKIPETVTISNNLKDRIEIKKKTCDNGDVLFRVELQIPENSGAQLVR